MVAESTGTLVLPPAVDEADRERLRRTWESKPGIMGWLESVNHKSVGKRYVITALVFFLFGGLEAGCHAPPARSPGERTDRTGSATINSSRCTARR